MRRVPPLPTECVRGVQPVHAHGQGEQALALYAPYPVAIGSTRGCSKTLKRPSEAIRRQGGGSSRVADSST